MSSSTDELIIEEKNHVGLITLNRPKVDHLHPFKFSNIFFSFNT